MGNHIGRGWLAVKNGHFAHNLPRFQQDNRGQRQIFEVDAQTAGEDEVEKVIGLPRLDQDGTFRELLDGAVLQQVQNGVQLDALPQKGSLQFPLSQRFLIITHLYQSSLKS